MSDKDFKVKNGLTVNGTVLVVNADTSRVGVGITNPSVALDVSGAIAASGDITTSSDIRLKSDITEITMALWRLNQLNGVLFTRLSDGERSTGLIAQDVLDVLPEAVRIGENGMLSVSYGNLAGLIVEAIKELTERVKILEKFHCAD